jgi:hypothetical protein
MQKVVGSSPIIRSRVPAKGRVLFITVTTVNGTLSGERSCRSWLCSRGYQLRVFEPTRSRARRSRSFRILIPADAVATPDRQRHEDALRVIEALFGTVTNMADSSGRWPSSPSRCGDDFVRLRPERS